jgi:hypothetical protein
VTKLTHPATGHQINVDDESADFWKAAGFQADQESTPKKAPAKKATAKKTSK